MYVLKEQITINLVPIWQQYPLLIFINIKVLIYAEYRIYKVVKLHKLSKKICQSAAMIMLT